MTIFFICLTLATIAVVVAVAMGKISGGLEAPTSTVPVIGIPEGPVTVAAVDGVRFAQALRGYRMDQVDAVLDRLTLALRGRDEQIVRLRLALADAGIAESEDDEPHDDAAEVGSATASGAPDAEAGYDGPSDGLPARGAFAPGPDVQGHP